MALKKLSSAHKLEAAEDISLDRLLDLHGTILEVGGGFWVKFTARRVKPSAARPHGLDYSLSFHKPDGERVLGYDNAHSVAVGRSPAQKRPIQQDHRHRGVKARPYEYTNAEVLLTDFWTDVEGVLKKEGLL